MSFQMQSHMPVLLCSVTGYDASGRVEDMAAELGKSVTPIAIGSAEGNIWSILFITLKCYGFQYVYFLR